LIVILLAATGCKQDAVSDVGRATLALGDYCRSLELPRPCAPRDFENRGFRWSETAGVFTLTNRGVSTCTIVKSKSTGTCQMISYQPD
jgi:hypothetical protein